MATCHLQILCVPVLYPVVIKYKPLTTISCSYVQGNIFKLYFDIQKISKMVIIFCPHIVLRAGFKTFMYITWGWGGVLSKSIQKALYNFSKNTFRLFSSS